MPSSSRKSAKPRKSVTSKKGKSFEAGKILPPLDIRSASSLGDLENRIKKGPVTIVLIYADWCSHCHEIMPHWDNAVKSKNRSIQAVKVNETMLSKMNEAVNQSINQSAEPINVSGYPSIVLVDKMGNKIGDIPPVKDQAVLSKVMSKSGPLAEKAGLSALSPDTSRWMKEKEKDREEMEEIEEMGEMGEKGEMGEMGDMGDMEEPLPLSPIEVQKQDSLSRPGLYASLPPSENELNTPVLSNRLSASNKLRGGSYGMNGVNGVNGMRQDIQGGSLYGAMAQSAYTLAPVATLFGMAAYRMKGKNQSKKSKKSKKSQKSKKTKKTKKTNQKKTRKGKGRSSS
jgi:thiol-disulfide isomerase/thioredoxin